MNIRILSVIIIFVTFLTSCENSNNKKSSAKQKIDYADKIVLDSLIKVTPHSSDTLFLGFTIGMTKAEYKKHIHKLRSEGKTVSYSSSNSFSSYISGAFELGAGYTFETSISTEKDGKTLTGIGQYFLEPVYNKKGNLMQLNILPIEEWDGDYGSKKPNWLDSKVIENSEGFKDQDLKQALIDNQLIDKNRFIRQKGNLVIYETILTINYIDLKTLLFELLMKVSEKETIKEENKDLRF